MNTTILPLGLPVVVLLFRSLVCSLVSGCVMARACLVIEAGPPHYINPPFPQEDGQPGTLQQPSKLQATAQVETMFFGE